MTTGATRPPHPEDAPVFVISVAAELAGMHAQTLRQYDRLGLVTPSRTMGGGRRYSAADIARLRLIQGLSQDEGLGLAAISRVLDLQRQNDALRARVGELGQEVARLRAALAGGSRVFVAGNRGDVVAMRTGQRPTRPPADAGNRALVVWRPRR